MQTNSAEILDDRLNEKDNYIRILEQNCERELQDRQRCERETNSAKILYDWLNEKDNYIRLLEQNCERELQDRLSHKDSIKSLESESKKGMPIKIIN